MKILMITGSPHKKGTSALLADRFIAGAERSGHQVKRFQAAFEEVRGCLGCGYCKKHGGECVQKDGMEKVKGDLLEADMIVFVTPLYYFGMSSQIKAVIDRFYAVNSALRAKPKKAMLLATCADEDDWAMDALIAHYSTVVKFLGWEDCGTLLAQGMHVREDIENSEYPQMAEKMGRGVGK